MEAELCAQIEASLRRLLQFSKQALSFLMFDCFLEASAHSAGKKAHGKHWKWFAGAGGAVTAAEPMIA
jgi:hypothetical protein